MALGVERTRQGVVAWRIVYFCTLSHNGHGETVLLERVFAAVVTIPQATERVGCQFPIVVHEMGTRAGLS